MYEELDLRFRGMVAEAAARSKVDWPRWFRRNGLPVWLFERELPVVPEEKIMRLVAAERQRHRRQIEEYEIVHREFARVGVGAMLFKSCGFPTEFPYYIGGHLDVLVNPRNLRRARAALDRLAYFELRSIEEPEKFLYKKCENGRAVSEIHLHTTVGWGVPFLCDEVFREIKPRISKDMPFVRYPSNTDGLLITLAHTFFEDKAFSAVNVLRVASCLLEDIEWDYVVWTARRRGWLSGLKRALGCYAAILENLGLATGEYQKGCRDECSDIKIKDLSELPVKYPFVSSKLFYYRKIACDKMRNRGQKLNDTLKTLLWGLELKLKLHFQRPYAVAFSGIDGSGKSTQAEYLAKTFELCGIKTARVWFRCFCSPVAGLFGRMRGRHARGPSSGIAYPPKPRGRQGLAGRLEYAFAVLELLYIYAVKARALRLLDRVAIFDRHLLDAAVELSIRYSKPDLIDSRLWRFVLAVSVVPDAHLFLDPGPEAMGGRVSDESPEFLRDMRDSYRRFTSRFPVEKLPAGGDREVLSRCIAHKVLKAYFRDWNLLSKRLLLATRSRMNPSLGEND